MIYVNKEDNVSAIEKTDILQHSIHADVIQEINLSETPFKRILAYLSRVEKSLWH